MGTTVAALLAVVPQVIGPFMGDRRFWADRAMTLGVATASPRRDPDRIAAAITDTIEHNTGTVAALAACVTDEDGPTRAVTALTR